MKTTAGSRLGPYEIVAPLGAGGMGEVWKGIDTRLGREVAIKILPPGFAQNELSRARFEREAKAVLLDSGHLVYVVDGTLAARPFDPGSLRFTGRPIPIADGVHYFMPTGQARFGAARNGTIVYRKHEINTSVLWFDAGGDQLGVLAENGVFGIVNISPDSEQAAISVIDARTGTSDVWLYGLSRKTTSRLTADPGEEGNPIWTPDGNSILFYSDRERLPDIYIKDLDGAGEERLVLGTDRLELNSDISPDGRHLIYLTLGPKGEYDLWVMPLDDSDSATVFVVAADNQGFARFSPDGGSWTVWARNELTLYFSNQSEMYSVDLSTPARRARPEPTSFSKRPTRSPPSTSPPMAAFWSFSRTSRSSSPTT